MTNQLAQLKTGDDPSLCKLVLDVFVTRLGLTNTKIVQCLTQTNIVLNSSTLVEPTDCSSVM